MTDLIPLFPLSTVLFPGAALPLHIFEGRYRQLIRDLVEGSERRWFGVVAIKRGSEVGDSLPELYDVGCIAVVRRVDAYPDGRYDLVAAGGPRFRVGAVNTESPYLRAGVQLLDEEPGEDPRAAAAAVHVALAAYLDALTGVGSTQADAPPDSLAPLAALDSLELSYRVAGLLQVEIDERQSLLACPTAERRLVAAGKLLRREIGLLRHFAAAQPAFDLSTAPYSLN